MSEKPILTAGEVAAKIRCDPKTLRKQVREGRCAVAPIQGMKPPKWRAVDVDKFLAGGE